MKDVGHERTEDLLLNLESKVGKIYTQAVLDMQEKLEKQLDKYQKKLVIKQAEYNAGKISKKDFDMWKQGQAHMQDNMKALADTLTKDLTNYNKIAVAMINGHTPEVYALNYNFGTYQIESNIKASTSFSLYNHFAVENLMRDNPQILPEWKIDEKKDYIWNYKKVNSALTQGILQGESIPKIAERFRTGLYAQNKNLMTTFARTATTGAQSSGRVDAYKRAKGLGINVKQKWLATLDGRTRHTHRLMDGKTINMGEKFDNGCKYPGDPVGPPQEVYNCRCTLVPVIKDFERDNSWKNKINYAEWEKGGSGFAHWLEEQADPDAAIMAEWSCKKYSFVYNLMKNSTVPGHGADANAFFNALKTLGQDSGIGSPPKVWNAYMTGQLDAEDLKKFEDIIKKYLPKDLQTPAGNPFAGKTWSEIIANEPKLVPGQPAMDYLLDNFDINWSDHLEDWANDKIKDSKLDELLLGKKAAKKIDNAAEAAKISKEAQNSLDKLKVKAGNPMTKEDADTYKVNPLYKVTDKTTTTNCQTTTFAYECRRQGYDIAALPKDNDVADVFSMQQFLGIDQGDGWINKTTGKRPKRLIAHHTNSYKSTDDIINELEEAVGTNGERYTLGVNWKNGGAHAVNLDRDEKGIIRIIDNQRGPKEKNTWTINEYLNEKNVKNIRALYRVDDCVPNAEYFNKIVVDANKMKTTVPVKISNLKPGEYAKVSKAAKAKGETPAIYYKKWKNGIIDDPDLDDIFKTGSKAKTVTPTPKAAPKPAAKVTTGVDLDVDAFSKKSASAVWKELNANKAGGGKFWKDITDIGKANGIKPAQAWKKYLAGELDADDVKKIEMHLAKIYKKTNVVSDATKVATKIDDIEKIKANLPDKMIDLDLDQFDEAKKIIKNYYDNPTAGQINDHYFMWKKGVLEDDDLDKLFSKKISSAPSLTTKTTVVDMDLLKTKKVSKVWNELKAQGGTAYSQFWKTVGEVGKDYGLQKKQSKVWDLYINGKLKPEESKKIDDFLLKHYFKKADNVIDYSKYGGKDIYDILKNYDSYFDFLTAPNNDFNKVLDFYGKNKVPGDAVQKAIDEIKDLEKNKITKATAKAAANKSDDLIKAEAKLKKAQDELKKIPNETYSGIWKEDVTLADYEAKKSTIKAKKIWYEDEIDKLKNDPSYKSWLSAEDKQNKIWDLEHHLDDLIDFEIDGKKYAKAQKAVNKAQQEVNKFAPSPFESNVYDDAIKKAAKSFTDKDAADKYHRTYLDSIWSTLTDQEKYGIWEYTRNSNPMNKSLSGYHDSWSRSDFIGFNKTDWGHEDSWRSLTGSWKKFGKDGHVTYHKAITDTTKGIQKSSLPQNTWLVRGSDNNGLAGMIEGKGFMSFNEAKKILDSGDISQIKAAFEGQVIKNHAFTSTGIAKGTGFGGEVKFEIYAPKGTHAIYAEPQSYFGNTSSNALYKAGKSYSSVGREAEVIVQRGTEYRITEIKKSGSGITVKMEIVDQPNYFKYGDEDTFNNGSTRHKK